mmetsp:Transcript_14506/g.41330  ORF Transcript_14506/g.41330 Transcript_14506/m.41330 type:complete len:336 (+) Transcript_14506:3866-4873(+)
MRERVVLDQPHRLLVVLLRFPREAADDIRRELEVRHEGQERVRTFPELLHGVLPVHAPEDAVAAGLDRDVQVREHERVVQDLRDFVQRVQHEGGVAHPHPQPRPPVLWQDGDYPSKEVRQLDPQVPSVRPSVLAAEPDLPHVGVLRGGPGPPHDRLRVVGAQLPPRVLRLAIRAAAEAPRGQRDDLDVLVLPHLGEVQPGQGLLGQQLHRVPLKRLLHRLHDPVDLRNPKQAYPLQSLDLLVPLRHAPGHHHRLPDPPPLVHDVHHRHLARVLHRARVHEPQVRFPRVLRDPVPVLLKLARHVLTVTRVVRATKRLDPDARRPRNASVTIIITPA